MEWRCRSRTTATNHRPATPQTPTTQQPPRRPVCPPARRLGRSRTDEAGDSVGGPQRPGDQHADGGGHHHRRLGHVQLAQGAVPTVRSSTWPPSPSSIPAQARRRSRRASARRSRRPSAPSRGSRPSPRRPVRGWGPSPPSCSARLTIPSGSSTRSAPRSTRSRASRCSPKTPTSSWSASATRRSVWRFTAGRLRRQGLTGESLRRWRTREERQLRELAERVRDELLTLTSVSLVEMLAVKDYQIDIEIPEQTLRRYGLTLAPGRRHGASAEHRASRRRDQGRLQPSTWSAARTSAWSVRRSPSYRSCPGPTVRSCGSRTWARCATPSPTTRCSASSGSRPRTLRATRPGWSAHPAPRGSRHERGTDAGDHPDGPEDPE